MKKVKFDSVKEFMKALLNGRRFNVTVDACKYLNVRYNDSSNVRYNDGEIKRSAYFLADILKSEYVMPITDSRGNVSHLKPEPITTDVTYDLTQFVESGSIKEIVDWYQNISDEGVLCWVWDEKPKQNIVALVMSTVDADWHSSRVFIDDRGEAWSNARPISLTETQGLLYDESDL